LSLYFATYLPATASAYSAIIPSIAWQPDGSETFSGAEQAGMTSTRRLRWFRAATVRVNLGGNSMKQTKELCTWVTRVTVCGATLFASSLGAFAQTVPAGAEPGRIPDRFETPSSPTVQARTVQGLESTIPPAEAAAITLKLDGVRISGSTVYPAQTFSEFYADLVGKTVTLVQVFDIAAKITAKYGQDGYILSRAIVPPQALDPKGATIQIQIIEGYINEVRWPVNTRVRQQFLEQYSAKITADRPLDVKTLERYLLLANDIPGTEFQSNLVASETTQGASDLVVTVEEDPVSGYVSIDNRGVEASGPLQLTFGGELNNYFGLNERLRASVTLAGPSSGGGTELRYLSFGYSQVLNVEGLTFFLDGNLSRGAPGTAALVALDYRTEGENISTGLTYAFIKTREQSLTGTIAFDWRNSRSFSLGALATEDRLRVIRGELAYENADEKGGQNQVTLAFSKGINGLGSTDNANPLASRTPGVVDFTKLTLELARTQQLDNGFSLYVHAFAQWTPNPLLSSQECGFGGQAFGGGFDSSIITGDTCVMASLELRKNVTVPDLVDEWVDYTQLFGFADYGKIWNITPPIGTPTQDAGASAGLGIRFGSDQFSTEMAVTTTLVTPTSQPTVQDVRAWLKTTWKF